MSSSQPTTSKYVDQNESVFARNGTQTSAASTASTTLPKKSVTNGMKTLSLRPSTGPQYRSTSSHVSVIDLETDSDRASKKSKKNDNSSRSTLSSNNMVTHRPTATSDTNLLVREVQPIGFVPTVAPPSRKPFTQSHSISGSESGHTWSQSSNHSSKLTKLYSPPKSQVRVVLPPTPKEKASRRREIIQKIKDDPTYIDENSQEVYNATGVKLSVPKDLYKEIHDKARQKKHQPRVDRSKILLDFGESPKPLTTTTTKTPLIHPRKQTRSILNERFERQGQAPLTFENRINDRRINGKFQFISNYVFSRRVQTRAQTPHPHRSCSCENGICGPDCSCLIAELMTRVGDVAHPLNIRTYQRHSQQSDLIVLSNALIEDTTHTAKIFECGDFCRCSKHCINRVVQKGRTVPLQIFETGKYGFGVRSSVPIVRGQFIDIYLGEVLTEQEVSKREAAAEEDAPSYIMSLDAFSTDEKYIFHVDGENFGTVTRFVNHSCEPNCKTIPVVLPKGSKQLYYVAFFAVKDIPADTELTIDYDPDLLVDNEVDDGVVHCQCGSAKCRKRLWAPSKEKRRRKKRYLPSKDDD